MSWPPRGKETHSSVALDELVPGCKYFKWGEILHLNRWSMYAHPKKNEYDNLILICKKADLVRELLDCPLTVSSGLRPKVYNDLIGGSSQSHHMVGEALDLRPKDKTMDMQTARGLVAEHAKEWGIRVERLPQSASWIHIDLGYPGRTGHYFKP